MSIRFAGYAAVFDRVDRGGDVIRPGAFAALPARVPLLVQHRGRPVGAIEYLATDARGLRVIARVDDPALAGMVRAGAGLSIGYRAIAATRASSPAGRVRELTRLDLLEVSLVALPMQRLARVHLVADGATVAPPDKGPDSRRPCADRGYDHG